LVLANFLLIYSHYFGWFVVFVQFIISFFYIDNRKIFRTLLAAILLTGVVFLPMAPFFIKQFFISSKGSWIQPPSNSEYLSQLFEFLNSKRLFRAIVLLMLIGFTYMIVTKKYKVIPREAVLFFVWWFIPYTIMFLVSSKVPMFINRYILFNSIGLYLFVAIVIGFLYNRILTYAITAFILTLMFFHLQINSKEFYYREVKNSVDFVRVRTNSNSIVLVYPPWADLGFTYYYNSEAFKNYVQFDTLLHTCKVYPVMDIDHAKEYLMRNRSNRIILFQDGSFENKTIFNHLDSTNNRIDSIFFPQCFMVGVFDPK